MTVATTLRRNTIPLSRVSDWAVYIALAALIVINVGLTPHFLTAGTVRAILVEACPPVLVALGMALCIGTRGIDLSVGAVMALNTALVQLEIGHGSGSAIAISLLVSAAAGAFSGVLVGYANINPLIVTLGMQVGVRGLAEVLTNGQLAPVTTSFFGELGSGKVAGLPYAVIITAVIAVIVWLTVAKTTFGHDVVAIGANRVASYLSGLRIRRALLAVYAISATLAGVASILATGRSQASDPTTLGLLFELDAIAAVVIGGTPLSGGRISIPGTVAGAVFLQLLSFTFVANNYSYDISQIISAVVIVVAVYFQRRRGG